MPKPEKSKSSSKVRLFTQKRELVPVDAAQGGGMKSVDEQIEASTLSDLVDVLAARLLEAFGRQGRGKAAVQLPLKIKTDCCGLDHEVGTLTLALEYAPSDTDIVQSLLNGLSGDR